MDNLTMATVAAAGFVFAMTFERVKISVFAVGFLILSAVFWIATAVVFAPIVLACALIGWIGYLAAGIGRSVADVAIDVYRIPFRILARIDDTKKEPEN